MKFNPVTTMKQLFQMMLKDKPSLVICNPTNSGYELAPSSDG